MGVLVRRGAVGEMVVVVVVAHEQPSLTALQPLSLTRGSCCNAAPSASSSRWLQGLFGGWRLAMGALPLRCLDEREA